MPFSHEQLQQRYGARYKWLVLLTLMIGSMAGIVSSTIVNVAIPDLSRHFTLGQERAQWVTAAFMLAMTLSMLLTPWLLQRYGLRRTYIATLLMLMTGGLAGGFSVNYAMLLAMRVLEGLATGIIQPLPAIVILRVFEQQRQGRAMGMFGFGVVLAPAIGPSVGGFLVELFGWRSIFFAVVPMCLLALALTRYLLPVKSIFMGQTHRLDWKGLLLACAATVCFLNGLVGLRADPASAALLLGLGLVAGAAFVAVQRRSEQPLLNLTLFGYRQFAMGALVSFIYGAGLFGSTYLLPVYMQLALGYTPSAAGLAMLPAGIVLAVAIWAAGRLTDRLPAHLMISAGLALLALSFVLTAFVTLATGLAILVLWIIVGRIGLGLVMPALSIGAMRGVEFGLIAQGTSALNFLRQLGGSIGVSMTGIVLEWRMRAHHTSLSPEQGVDPAQRLLAFDETFLLVAAICGIAMLAAWNMRPAARQPEK
ncbi:MAG: DHA2 family efflux MFS transporter permease subunit [Noviherbaspirillum sp.]